MSAEAMTPELQVSTVEDFAAIEEDGADALVGTTDAALIPEGGDVMLYGDGGSAKTTLGVDLGFHLGAGDSWLGIPIARPVRVMLMENEGPRPLFRVKAKRKLAGWTGSALEGRVIVVESPWARLSFADPHGRATLARAIREHESDVLIAGPVTRLGMDEAGTLQQVRDFSRLIDEVRAECGRLLTVILVHHESKGGAVSGAWEGAGDTLLHLEGRGHGHTHVHVQKARWSSEHHDTHLDLVWTDGEGFAVGEARERDYAAEMVVLLSDGKYRTAREIAARKDAAEPGIGASPETIKETLRARPDVFDERTKEAAVEVGRHWNATVYGLHSAPSADGADRVSQRSAAVVCTSAFSLRNAEAAGADQTTQLGLHPPLSADATDNGLSEEQLQALVDSRDAESEQA